MSLRSFFILTGFLTAAVLAGRAAERGLERTFSVEPGCTLRVDTYRGSIAVVEGDAPEIRVSLQLNLGTDNAEEADRAQAALQFEATEENNTVTLRARNPRETGPRFVWNDRQAMTLAWRITVPRRCNVEALTRAGAITVGSLTGRVVAQTEIGTLYLKRIDGSIDARTGQGDVIVSRCTGPVVIRAQGGTIRTGTLGGTADLKNINGDIEVLASHAGLSASAEAGDVQVGFPRDLTGDARLTTSGGSIRVTIDPAANCAINAASGWGRVESSLPMIIDSGANGKSKLVGHLGQDGVSLTLRASGGHVRIAPGETYFE